MVGLFLGILFGTVSAATIFSIMNAKLKRDIENYYHRKSQLITGIFIIVFSYGKRIVPILVFIVSVYGGIEFDKNLSRRYVYEYIAKKETIEASLQNENLAGLERMRLVEQAAEANQELAGIQYDCQQWYGFFVDDRVLELEPIDISGNAE